MLRHFRNINNFINTAEIKYYGTRGNIRRHYTECDCIYIFLPDPPDKDRSKRDPLLLKTCSSDRKVTETNRKQRNYLKS